MGGQFWPDPGLCETHPAHRTAELRALAGPQALPSQPRPHLAQSQKQVLQDAIGLSSDVFLSLHLEI